MCAGKVSQGLSAWGDLAFTAVCQAFGSGSVRIWAQACRRSMWRVPARRMSWCGVPQHHIPSARSYRGRRRRGCPPQGASRLRPAIPDAAMQAFAPGRHRKRPSRAGRKFDHETSSRCCLACIRSQLCRSRSGGGCRHIGPRHDVASAAQCRRQLDHPSSAGLVGRSGGGRRRAAVPPFRPASLPASLPLLLPALPPASWPALLPPLLLRLELRKDQDLRRPAPARRRFSCLLTIV
jgi:hypothetical protein